MVARFAPTLATVAMLGAAACQQAPAALSEADRQAIQAASDQFVQHILAKNWDALSKLYAGDAVLMPPNQPAVVGRAAIREFNATFPPLAAFSLTNEMIDGAGDLAYVRGRYRMTLAIEGSPADSGKYIEIRRRQADGSWKLSADIFNSDVPLPAVRSSVARFRPRSNTQFAAAGRERLKGECGCAPAGAHRTCVRSCCERRSGPQQECKAIARHPMLSGVCDELGTRNFPDNSHIVEQTLEAGDRVTIMLTQHATSEGRPAC